MRAKELSKEELEKALNDIRTEREDREARIEKNSLAFLEKCKGEDLTIYEVEKTIEEIQKKLRYRVTLGSGLKG